MWEGGGGGAKSSTLLLIGIALTGCQTPGAPAKEQSVCFQKLEDGRVSHPLPIPVLFYFLKNFCNCIIRATSALFCRSSNVYQPRVPALNSGQFQAFSTQVSLTLEGFAVYMEGKCRELRRTVRVRKLGWCRSVGCRRGPRAGGLRGAGLQGEKYVGPWGLRGLERGGA